MWLPSDHQKRKVLVAQSCLTLCDPINCSLPNCSPLSMEFSRQNTGVGWHSLLQGIFLTQGSNPGLLHCRQTLYRLSYQGRPLIFPYRPAIIVICVIQNKLLEYSITSKQLIFTFNSVNVCFIYLWVFPGGSDGKESSCNAGDQCLISGLGRPPWRKEEQPSLVFCPGKSLG